MHCPKCNKTIDKRSAHCRRHSKLGVKRKPFSEEWKRNMAIALTGRKWSKQKKEQQGVRLKKYWAGRTHPLKGQKQTPEFIEKRARAISKGKTGKPCLRWRGAGNPSWKGGITPVHQAIRGSLEYKNWRRAVFKRDDYTCRGCKARSCKGRAVYLEADHIEPFAYYPKLRFDITNGRTLCKECHKKTDTYAKRKKSPIKKLENPQVGL